MNILGLAPTHSSSGDPVLSESYDIRCFKSATLNLSITAYTDDQATTLWNLTGYSAAFTVKDKPGGSTIATLTDGSGITLGGSAGTIIVKRSPAQLAAWKLDKGAYELTITSGAGDTTMILFGDLELITT